MKTTSQRRVKVFSLKNAGVCALVAAALVGCGDGGSSSNTSSAASAKPAKLNGMLINAAGPITEGTVDAVDAKGSTVATAHVSGSNQYKLDIPAGVVYPVVLTAKPTGGGEAVKAVVTSSLAEKMDISTVSNLIVDGAMQMGGLTPANLAKASIGAINQRQSTGGGGGAGAGGFGAGPGNTMGGMGRSGGSHGGHGNEGGAPAATGEGEQPANPHAGMSH